MSYEILFTEFHDGESRFHVADCSDAETISGIENVFRDWYYSNVRGGGIMLPEDQDGGRILFGISEDGLDRIIDGINGANGFFYNGERVYADFC